MIRPVFWIIAFLAGLGLAYFIAQIDSIYIQPTPSLLPFMLLMLIIVTVLYQVRFNLENPPPKPVTFVFAPPTASIFGELIAIFLGSSLLNQMNG
ncbi:MAG: hypothetical protein SGJ17_12870 [Hyphomicrobiales bacterium]|nr:hypothetical protein [Hyphomicrobiales bacterium]